MCLSVEDPAVKGDWVVARESQVEVLQSAAEMSEINQTYEYGTYVSARKKLFQQTNIDQKNPAPTAVLGSYLGISLFCPLAGSDTFLKEPYPTGNLVCFSIDWNIAQLRSRQRDRKSVV